MNEPTMDDKIQQLVTAVLEAVDARLDGIRHELVQFAADADQRHHDVLGTVATLQRRVDELAARPTPAPAAVPAPTATDNHQSVADLNERLAQATKILVERMEAAHRDAAVATDRKVAQLAEQIELVRTAAAAATTRMPAPVADPSPSPRAASAVGTAVALGESAEVPEPVIPQSAVPEPSESELEPAPAPHAPAAAMSGSFGHVTGQLPHLNDDALAEISRPLYANGHITGSTPRVTDTARVRQVTAPPMPPLVTPSMSPSMSPSTSPAGAMPPAHAAHEDIDIARLTSLISEKLDHLSLPNRPE